MSYATPQALRMALEQRLNQQARDSGISIDRLRRRVIFERIVSRLEVAEPGQWVLKGGMAIEVRLRDSARLSKDIDLGLRTSISDEAGLQERLIEALGSDPFDDGFVFAVAEVRQLMEDGAGHLTWRTSVACNMAGKPFGGIKVDISPRAHELRSTEQIQLPNTLVFAGIGTPTIEIIDVNRHAAEKYHAMLKDFGKRENTRVRDLLDLVILREHALIATDELRVQIHDVWRERDNTEPPRELPPLPPSWPERYERLAADYDLDATSFPDAVALITALWAELFPTEET